MTQQNDPGTIGAAILMSVFAVNQAIVVSTAFAVTSYIVGTVAVGACIGPAAGLRRDRD